MKPMIFAALALTSACAARTPNEVQAVSPTSIAPALGIEAARTSPAKPEPSAACDIRETKTAKGVRLEAVARSDQALRGTYDFVVTAQTSGGLSDISQGGEIDLAARQQATVGSAEIPRGRYRAVLTLRDATGELCSSERTS